MSPESKAIQTEGSPGVGGMEARFSVSRRAAGEEEAALGGLCVSDWEVVPGLSFLEEVEDPEFWWCGGEHFYCKSTLIFKLY